MHQFYAACRAHFGYTPVWWPGTPWELTLTAVLVQQCDWAAAWAAIGNLAAAGIRNVPELAAASADDVRNCVRSVTFAPTKASRLIGLAAGMLDQGFETIEDLLESSSTERVRERLLLFRGIGPETADCILLYASRHATFVADAYARRVFQRLGVLPLADGFWARPYEDLRQFVLSQITGSLALYDDFDFAPGVPRAVALLRDYHAQVVELGKHHCLKNQPRCRWRGKDGWKDYFFCRDHCANNGCAGCPLSGVCASEG